MTLHTNSAKPFRLTDASVRLRTARARAAAAWALCMRSVASRGRLQTARERARVSVAHRYSCRETSGSALDRSSAAGRPLPLPTVARAPVTTARPLRQHPQRSAPATCDVRKTLRKLPSRGLTRSTARAVVGNCAVLTFCNDGVSQGTRQRMQAQRRHARSNYNAQPTPSTVFAVFALHFACVWGLTKRPRFDRREIRQKSLWPRPVCHAVRGPASRPV